MCVTVQSLLFVQPLLVPCTGRKHQMTPAAHIDRPSSSWFRLTLLGSIVQGASKVGLTRVGKIKKKKNLSGARTPEGIIPLAGGTGTQRLLKLACSGAPGNHSLTQFSPLSAIIHVEDQSIMPGTCLIYSSPRYTSD